MTMVARLGSTVETVASLSDDSIKELHQAGKRFSQQRSKVDAELEDFSAVELEADESVEGEEGGEGSSETDVQAAEEMKDEDQLNIVYKLRQARRDDDMSDEDDKQLTNNDEAKK